MALKMRDVHLSTTPGAADVCRMPAEIKFPFILHRLYGEWYEKHEGERSRYSSTVVITHLFTGLQYGVFASYSNAAAAVSQLQDDPIWLMPTEALLIAHPDWAATENKAAKIKQLFS